MCLLMSNFTGDRYEVLARWHRPRARAGVRVQRPGGPGLLRLPGTCGRGRAWLAVGLPWPVPVAGLSEGNSNPSVQITLPMN